MSAEQTRAEQVAEVLATHERCTWTPTGAGAGVVWTCGVKAESPVGGLPAHQAAALADALPDPEQAVREALDLTADEQVAVEAAAWVTRVEAERDDLRARVEALVIEWERKPAYRYTVAADLRAALDGTP